MLLTKRPFYWLYLSYQIREYGMRKKIFITKRFTLITAMQEKLFCKPTFFRKNTIYILRRTDCLVYKTSSILNVWSVYGGTSIFTLLNMKTVNKSNLLWDVAKRNSLPHQVCSGTCLIKTFLLGCRQNLFNFLLKKRYFSYRVFHIIAFRSFNIAYLRMWI